MRRIAPLTAESGKVLLLTTSWIVVGDARTLRSTGAKNAIRSPASKREPRFPYSARLACIA